MYTIGFSLFERAWSLRGMENLLIDFVLNPYIYNTFQPEIYDINKVKKEFGSHLSFYGGISMQHILPHGTPTQVKEEVRKMMEVMGENGGYIVAPNHAIPNDVPTEGICELLEVVHNQ